MLRSVRKNNIIRLIQTNENNITKKKLKNRINELIDH